MVYRYKSHQWYEVDILINWGPLAIEKTQAEEDSKKRQYVQIFVDGEYLGTEPFFHSERIGASNSRANEINSTNALILYGLSPGTYSRFKDVKLCIERCPGSEGLEF